MSDAHCRCISPDENKVDSKSPHTSGIDDMKTCDLGISYPGLGIRSRVRVGDKVAQLVTCQTSSQ